MYGVNNNVKLQVLI